MRQIFHQEKRIVENRFLWANILVILVSGILLVRIWYVQIYKGDYYRKISENNHLQYIEIPAPRGLIFDRNGQVVLGNRPYFDLIFLPQFGKESSQTFKVLGKLLNLSPGIFERRFKMSLGQPRYMPVGLKRNLSLHEVSVILSNKIFLPGVNIAVAPRRDYKPETPSHLVGYLGEIGQKDLKKLNKESADWPYRAGDLIGKQGLEKRWEKYLRGKRGHRLIHVDAFGREAPSLERSNEIPLPQTQAVPGADLILTLDSELQSVARNAFKGKNGAVVVLDPRNGEVLAMVSEPGYDPNLYQGILSAEKYRSLLANPFKPFLDKTTGGTFIPGSVYKAVVAIAGLEERIVDAQTTYYCPGSYTLGGQTFHCWEHGGHGVVNLKRALMKSCDVYFYNLGVELGVDRIAKYAYELGLGQKAGLLLNFEMPGLVPTSAWKRLNYRLPWSAGETPSISIGQGANQMTPVQMANLYATIGNEGKIWRPFIVKRVINHIGETIQAKDPELVRTIDKIKTETFRMVKEGLAAVVMDKEGTGKNAAGEGYTVAGKTGSVQVVSLSKNNKNTDVSMMWREHAMFAAFSPVDNPEIAIAVVSEHDKVGGGGRSAAPVAGQIIKAYWQLKAKRQNVAGKTIPQPGH